MADSLDPHDIARHSFEVARRGYEQQEVRGYLHEVSALVERLLRSEKELRERAERAEARLGAAESPDEAAMLEVLGEETTRVLTSAREAASEIRAKAEASAERLIAEALAEAAAARGAAEAEAAALLAEATAEGERILEAARTELARRTAEAEEVATRISEGGAAQAEALREEGQRALDAAQEEADELLESARTEGRTMVGEAQAVRERVLRDLAARRKKARIQVEKLNAGRERLLEAYEVVRRTIDEATGELTVSLSEARLAADAAARRLEAESEPSLGQLDEEVASAGLIDLPIAQLPATDAPTDHDEHDTPGPFSGEVPAVEVEPDADASPGDPAPSSDDPAPAEPAADRRSRRSRRRKGAYEGLPQGEVIRVQMPDEAEGVRIVADPVVTPEAEEASGGAATADEGTETAGSDDDAAASPGQDPTPAEEPEAEVAPEEPAEVQEPVQVEEPEGAEAGEATPGPGDEDAVPAADAGDVFARLRAEQAGEAAGDEPDAPVAADATSDGEAPEADGAPEADDPVAARFRARDESLAAIDKELSRRLKRSLADEQNEVLDLLRREKPKGVDDVLPALDDHAARWAEAAAPALHDAASAGATSAGGSAGTVTDLADELARSLVGPLRERMERSFVASDGNLDDVADRVRALYREWKGKRLTETSQHFVAAAYARGAFDAVAVGAEVRWVVDPAGTPCPDCDDNVLAGALAKGEPFPTGSPCAPAHPGCRCLVLPA